MKRKSTKVQKRKIRRSPRRKVATSQIPEVVELNYERALAKNVIDGKARYENEDAVTLAAAVSSLTGSLKKISYNYGVSVGRSVYKVFEEKRRYRWYGESIRDIVLFFEKLGYDYILYKIPTDNVEVSIYRKNRVNLSCNIHSFDSGVIAGFLGAARGNFVKVTEVSCCNNGSDHCRFTTASVPEDPFCTDVKKVTNLFEEYRSAGEVRQEYQVLVTEPLFNSKYSAQINSIYSYLGRSALWPRPGKKLMAKSVKDASETMRRFGLGEADYTPRPQKIQITLDGAKAKKEFVDISISFLNGMMGRHLSKQFKPSLASGRNGSYRITMRQ